MSGARMTSTGHAVSDAPWLDLHFQTARAKYQETLRFVGIEPIWAVLDAGCGSGGYVPLLCELVGPTGQVTALDLALENVSHVERLVREVSPTTAAKGLVAILAADMVGYSSLNELGTVPGREFPKS
jgi:arsenite methyltransferase